MDNFIRSLPKFLTVNEAAELLRVSHEHFRRSLQSQMEVVAIGGRILIPREEIDKFVRANIRNARQRENRKRQVQLVSG